ncbi:MAG: YdbL family protein [Rickettsiales bacterium]
MKKRIITAIAVALFALPAFALDLNTARSSGAVGEKADGYLTVLKASGDVSALVAEVNAKRKAEYERISKSNGQTAAVVGALAAPQIAKGLPAGSQYQGTDGSWKTR